MNILHVQNHLVLLMCRVIRQYHALFIFNHVNSVLIVREQNEGDVQHVLKNTPFTQYCYEEYIRPTSYLRFLSYHDSCLRSHISFIIHQLRLRFDQIHQHDEISTEDVKLGELLEKDYYYQKLLPLVICDSVKCVYLKQHKKVLQNGVMTHVLDVSARCRSYDQCTEETLVTEAHKSKCLDFGY